MAPAAHRDLIVIGASAGGVGALKRLAGGLPRDLAAAVLVVLHIGARRSVLPDLLSAAGPLPAAYPADGDPLLIGRIMVAPPDRHLIVERDRVRLTRGPAENRTRPAIDPLFRSAAENYGPKVAGVILSGLRSDGSAGFVEIKRRGGITIVQDPDEAEFPDMPLSALRHTTVDHCAPVASIADLLVELSGRTGREGATRAGIAARSGGGAARIGKGEEEAAAVTGGYDFKPPVALTCPDCGGALAHRTENSLPYYVCHIGHRYAAADMDEAQFREMEKAMEVALRSLGERASLCAGPDRALLTRRLPPALPGARRPPPPPPARPQRCAPPPSGWRACTNCGPRPCCGSPAP
jgi:two-component system, chemotaxis family, protein-glutamate methylesterase/glutaminase